MSRPAKPHTVENPLRIRIVSNAEDARRLRRGGYCPVECSFGSESVVDDLQMDHHGDLHDLTGVGLRAYTELFGKRAARPRFVVTGHADEDATWAVGSLAGLLPHPSREREFRHAPETMRRLWTRDWIDLVRCINRVDTEPDGVNLSASREGRIMLLWRLLGSFPLRDTAAFYAGVDRWRSLLTKIGDSDLEQVPQMMQRRLRRVRGLSHERFGRSVALVDASIWGYSAVYAAAWYRAFRCPVLLVFQPRPSGRGIVTVAVRNVETARKLFGSEGLLGVFPRLRPGRWGGRPDIGGSDRGRSVSWQQARRAAEVVARHADG